MVETIAQIFGMTFVGIIIVCVVITFGDYIIEDYKLRKNKNENTSKTKTRKTFSILLVA